MNIKEIMNNKKVRECGKFILGWAVILMAVAWCTDCVKALIDKRHNREERELSANVMQVTKDGVTSIINSGTGKTLIRNIQVDWVQEGHDSLAVFSQDKLRGYFNVNTGEVTVEPQYKHAWIYSEGLAGVVSEGNVGFIDTKGRVVIDFRFPYFGNGLYEYVFLGGHCAVADTTHLIGVIDSVGQWVIEPKYKNVTVSKDFAIVTTEDGFKQQLDYDGTVMVECVIDYVSTLRYEVAYTNRETGEPAVGYTICADYYEYNVGSRCGLMNSRGEFITAPIYHSIDAIGPCTFRATLQDSYTEVIINEQGQVLSRKK